MIKEYEGHYDRDNNTGSSSGVELSMGNDQPAPKPALPPAVQKFMDDEDVPAALKKLYTDILPAKDFAAFEKMLKSGALDNTLTITSQPLGGLITLIAAAIEDKDELAKWLAPVCKHTAFDTASLGVTTFYVPSAGSKLALKDFKDDHKITQLTLAQYLFKWRKMTVVDIAGLNQNLLQQSVPNDNSHLYPLLAYSYSNYGDTLTNFKKIAEATGSTGFLFFPINYETGHTLFFKAACDARNAEDSPLLNLLSWMLERAPSLIDSRDEYGWTVLDRYISSTTSHNNNNLVRSSLLRLLVSAGAQLNRQLTPDFNLAAEMEKRESLKKDPLRSKPANPPQFRKP